MRGHPRQLFLASVLLCALLGTSPGLVSGAPTATRNAGPRESGCPIFPASNPLTQEIAHAPADPNSAAYIASIGLSGHLHPDFGTEPGYGIPFAVVGPHQPKVPITFT